MNSSFNPPILKPQIKLPFASNLAKNASIPFIACVTGLPEPGSKSIEPLKSPPTKISFWAFTASVLAYSPLVPPKVFAQIK